MNFRARPLVLWVLCILALLILALVALSPGFVWSRVVPQQPTRFSSPGAHRGAPGVARPGSVLPVSSFCLEAWDNCESKGI